MSVTQARIVLLLAMTWLASGTVRAQAHGGSTNPCAGEDKVVMDVLDPGLDFNRKAPSLQVMQSLAAEGCGDASWVLGNLQRLGPELPGNPVSKDVVRAAASLEQAGLAGVDAAYMDLAELALHEGKPSDAMLWTQIWLWLGTTGPDATRKTAEAYGAPLLLRATRAWRAADLENARIQSLLDAYLAEHGASLLDARKRLLEMTAGQPHLALAERPRVHPGDVGRQSGYVMFRLEANPSGEVTRIAVESYGPTSDVVERLRPIANDVRLVPFDSTEARTGTLPIVIAAGP